MGGSIEIINAREVGGEPVGDLVVTASALNGVEPDPARAPSMIDEYPVAFVAAAFAHGRSIFRGLDELRVKESDRIATMATGLRAIGVTVEELEDGIIIEGSGGQPPAERGSTGPHAAGSSAGRGAGAARAGGLGAAAGPRGGLGRGVWWRWGRG